MNVVADRLKEAMADRGIDQSTLAGLVGVTQGTISLILVGKTRHSKYLVDIAIELGVNYDWLIGRSDQKSSPYEEVDARVTRDDLELLRTIGDLSFHARTGLRAYIDMCAGKLLLPTEHELRKLLERLLADASDQPKENLPQYLAAGLIREVGSPKALVDP